MSKFKHPNNRYERRLIGKAKQKPNRPRKGATPMEELRTIETTISADHLKEHVAQFLDAINLIHPDEEVIEIEGLPSGNIPIKIKFTKKLTIDSKPPREEVEENS